MVLVLIKKKYKRGDKMSNAIYNYPIGVILESFRLPRSEAIKKAISIAKKDDAILLAGKGHETYQVIGKERVHYDEREVVADVLKDGF